MTSNLGSRPTPEKEALTEEETSRKTGVGPHQSGGDADRLRHLSPHVGGNGVVPIQR